MVRLRTLWLNCTPSLPGEMLMTRFCFSQSSPTAVWEHLRLRVMVSAVAIGWLLRLTARGGWYALISTERKRVSFITQLILQPFEARGGSSYPDQVVHL